MADSGRVGGTVSSIASRSDNLPVIRSRGRKGRKRGTNMSQTEIMDLAELTAREMLGVSRDEAFAMLDRGELEGTLAGGSLQSFRWLLAD